jgi:FKBP-type peptidyl-prolyl cis-trans isomerase
MTTYIRSLTVAAIVAIAPINATTAEETMSENHKTIFSAGMMASIFLSLNHLQPSDEEFDTLIQGMKAHMTGDTSHGIAFNHSKLSKQYHQLLDRRIAKADEAAREVEEKKREAFLITEAKKTGANKTQSGLIYTILTEGDGATPQSNEKVKVHYHGTLIDGTVFDSSTERGQPITFGLNQVIPCWTEGVQKIKVGGKARLVCPPEIAYGNRAVGDKIKPRSTLIFEVELLDIVQ